MTHEERTKKVEEFFARCLSLQKTKGKDYTTEGDAFKDLCDEARSMGVTPEIVLWISMNKHYKAVRKYCRYGQTESEPIEGRLADLANYVSLIYAYIQERNKPQ
jgi:hypothetical protein